MKRIAFTLLFLLFLASACVPAGSQNAPTVSPALTLVTSTHLTPDTPTPDTPTPEPTATPTETPTPEVKQFPICQIENFRDCPITVDDLFNGNYLAWLNTLSKPFDQAKIKQVPMEVVFGNIITYNTKTAPNFRDPATAPFRRDVTAGYASYQGIDYIVMPVEYFDPKHPDKNQWVITVDSTYYPGHDQKEINQRIPFAIAGWRKGMKITAILNTDIMLGNSTEDPLVKKTFDNNLDMAERFNKFMSGEDMGALSKPGIVLLNYIGGSSDHWLE